MEKLLISGAIVAGGNVTLHPTDALHCQNYSEFVTALGRDRKLFWEKKF